MRLTAAFVLAGAALIVNAASAANAATAQAPAPPPAAPAPAAKDAGQRYGQALGVLEVCYGSKLTDKGKALATTYTGTDLETFKAAAAGIYDAWVKVRGCTNQKDPNTCKIIMDRSCQAAQSEIGPSGSAMAGLVDFAR